MCSNVRIEGPLNVFVSSKGRNESRIEWAEEKAKTGILVGGVRSPESSLRRINFFGGTNLKLVPELFVNYK